LARLNPDGHALARGDTDQHALARCDCAISPDQHALARCDADQHALARCDAGARLAELTLGRLEPQRYRVQFEANEEYVGSSRGPRPSSLTEARAPTSATCTCARCAPSWPSSSAKSTQ
jgi:hypothetical protein